MPKHLTSIPTVDTLPDVADQPEGYPVIFEGMIHALQDDGAEGLEWVVVGMPLPDYSGAAEGATLEIVSGEPAWVDPA